jgi:hypothetical protein
MRAPLVAVLVFLGAVAVASPATAGEATHRNSQPVVVRAAHTGEAAKSPAEILRDATTAMTSAPVVLVTGTVQSKDGRTSLKIASGHGTGGGVMFLDGQEFDIVVAAPNVYVKGTAAAWATVSGNPAAGAVLGGRWVQSTTDDKDFSGLASLADLSGLSQSMLTVSGTLTKGPVTDFQGRKAIPLHDDGAEPGTLYVAATGTPYPLGLVRTTGEPGQVVFSHYGKAKIPAPPAQFVSLSQLQSAGTGS